MTNQRLDPGFSVWKMAAQGLADGFSKWKVPE
jgi:hypothetical protein